jgi:hypothetical protein
MYCIVPIYSTSYASPSDCHTPVVSSYTFVGAKLVVNSWEYSVLIHVPDALFVRRY